MAFGCSGQSEQRPESSRRRRPEQRGEVYEELTFDNSPVVQHRANAYRRVSAPARGRVLLTGGTGFLGGAFLAHARELSAVEWVLPARGASDAEARQRLWRRLTRFVDEVTAARILSKATVVRADLMDPTSLAPSLLEGVTHVVHLAANTSFIAKSGVWSMNVEGTRALAQRLRGVSTLKRFVYVGTAMICGDNPAQTVEEDSYPLAAAEHLLSYTASKAAAEQMLREEFSDLPLVVARPSIVIGHTKLGCAPSGSIFWVVRALERLRLLAGSEDACLDVVPSDYVAQALDHLTFAPELRYRCYHISAGRESATPIRRTAARLALASSRCEEYTIIDSTDARKHQQRMVDAFGPAHGRRVLMALGLYLRFCELNVRFDNRRLREEGLPPAPSLLDYLDTCLAQSASLSIVEQADDEI
jgi:nucleoside-diphosphate-sugar epimerase